MIDSDELELGCALEGHVYDSDDELVGRCLCGERVFPRGGPGVPELYLGTHKAVWLARLIEPLFVSRRTLAPRRTLPRSAGRWALDSGGFTELHMHGEWSISAETYVLQVRRFAEEIGNLEWAAPQDWMVEPSTLAKTGLDVVQHQTLTVHNLLYLRNLAADLPFVPVLQGWTRDDYLRCVDLFDRCGIDLTAEPLVGVGSVCRRGVNSEIVRILADLGALGLRLHAFGIRAPVIRRVADLIVSADSMAWSYQARFETGPMPGCSHAKCSNCPRYAVAWRARQLESLDPTLWRVV